MGYRIITYYKEEKKGAKKQKRMGKSGNKEQNSRFKANKDNYIERKLYTRHKHSNSS